MRGKGVRKGVEKKKAMVVTGKNLERSGQRRTAKGWPRAKGRGNPRRRRGERASAMFVRWEKIPCTPLKAQGENKKFGKEKALHVHLRRHLLFKGGRESWEAPPRKGQVIGRRRFSGGVLGKANLLERRFEGAVD